MRVLFLSAVLMTVTFSSLAQERSSRWIVWTSDAACQFRKAAFTAKDRISCTSISTERGLVTTISLNEITFSAAFQEKDDHIIVGARIANASGEPIMFDSDMWGAAHFKTRSKNYAGEKPLLAETSIPTRDMIRGELSEARIGGASDKAVADTRMKAETRTGRRPDGTLYRIDVLVPDAEERSAAARRASNELELVLAEQKRIRETALTAKSVRANSVEQGLVYFRRVTEANLVIFTMEVGGVRFVFPTVFDAKNSSSPPK